MPTLAAVADSYADELKADVEAGGEPTPTPYLTLLARLGEAVGSLRTRAIGWMDNEDEEVAREAFDAYVDLVEASHNQPRQAANATRLPATDEPARDILAAAQAAVSRLIAERDGLADQRDRQAAFIERLETRVRELEDCLPIGTRQETIDETGPIGL
jgi:hypothetical protein